MSIIFILLGLSGAYAQDAISTAGGEASGAGGTASYSIGQATYITHAGANGSVGQGVQQPYSISTITGVEILGIDLGLVAYPNPTTDYLSLQINHYDNEDLSYQLYDIQGGLKRSSQLTSGSTIINMENLPEAVYILKVSGDQKVIKSFKIIKN